MRYVHITLGGTRGNITGVNSDPTPAAGELVIGFGDLVDFGIHQKLEIYNTMRRVLDAARDLHYPGTGATGYVHYSMPIGGSGTHNLSFENNDDPVDDAVSLLISDSFMVNPAGERRSSLLVDTAGRVAAHVINESLHIGVPGVINITFSINPVADQYGTGDIIAQFATPGSSVIPSRVCCGEMTAGGVGTPGIGFVVNVPETDEIVSATLAMEQTSDTNVPVEFNVELAELANPAAIGVSNPPQGFTPICTAAVNIPPVVGAVSHSFDVKPLIEELLADTAWEEGNRMNFRLSSVGAASRVVLFDPDPGTVLLTIIHRPS